MTNASSPTNDRVIFISGILMLVIMVGLSGCAPLAATATKAPEKKATPCTQPSDKMNIYKNEPMPVVDRIFQYAYPYSSLPTPVPPANTVPIQLNEQQILEARYAAFQYLINQTKRWSDIETIKLDDSSEAQVIITFISPELLQAVYLNEVMKYRIYTTDFPVQLKSVLNSVANRNELIFLLTVTATNNGNRNSTPHVISIAVGKMDLNNSENLQIAPNHDDHNLEQPINTSADPVFGYLAYPLATNNDCKWILDPKYNTKIVITIPKIQVDGNGDAPYTWTIPYAPLISENIPRDAPVFAIPQGYDINLISTQSLPPSAMMNLYVTNPDVYWRDFARYVWNQITLGNY